MPRRGQARGALELPHQLPAIQGVQEIDIPRLAIEHRQGKFPRLHENTGRFLIGIAAIFQFQLRCHGNASFSLSHFTSPLSITTRPFSSSRGVMPVPWP